MKFGSRTSLEAIFYIALKINFAMSNEVFNVGVERADITPPVGIRLMGYMVREGVSKRIDEPLTVTVLIVRGTDQTIAIIAHDWCLASADLSAKMRERCGKALGIPAKHVLINFNHSHSAPVVPGWIPYDTDEQLSMQIAHAEAMLCSLEQACAKAVQNLQPARMAVGWGECFANINRREKTPDGTVMLGEDPSGHCDHSVGVIRFDRLDGTPLVVLFRYSCHPVTLGPRTNIISPDFVGSARKIIENTMGCLSMFLQGCAGNINPATGIGQTSDDAHNVCEDKERIGQMLGGEVLKICGSLTTHRRRKEPRLIHSIAVYWLYEYVDIPPGSEGSVHTCEREITLPLVSFPPLAEVQHEREEYAKHLSDALQNGHTEPERQVAKRFDIWAQCRLEAATLGPNPHLISFPIQVIAFGDIAIVAIPMEVMSETGSLLRSTSPLPNTFVLGYSNGSISYLPTPEISKEGGMESKLAYKAYYAPAEIPGDWEPRVRQVAIELLEECI